MVIDWKAIPVISDLVNIIIDYSPRAVFAIVALVLGWVIGRLVSFLIKSVVGKMKLEILFRKISVGRSILRAGYTPSSFFATVAKGAIHIFSVLFALKLLSIPLLIDSVQAIIDYIPNLIGGALILIVGFTFVDWIGETVEKGSSSIVQPSLLSGLIRILLYFVTITIALAHMKIDVTILYIFAQAFAWSLAIAIGIAVGWNLKDKVGLWLEKMTREEKDKNTA